MGKVAKETPGVCQVITIAGISALDNNSALANAGLAYIMLNDWSKRGSGEDLASLYKTLNVKLKGVGEGRRTRSSATADPGYRQCRRVHHAD